jgi:malonyl CoA-acyl carrier protein transacylase
MFVALRSPAQWLHKISTYIDRGMKQFICVGLIRVIAQQLSRERTLRERAQFVMRRQTSRLG